MGEAAFISEIQEFSSSTRNYPKMMPPWINHSSDSFHSLDSRIIPLIFENQEFIPKSKEPFIQQFNSIRGSGRHCGIDTERNSSHSAQDEKVILAPFSYISSLPGKGVRNILIDAINIWFQAPEKSLAIIKKTVDLLHTSSLMFDDVEDCSSLRRGKPTTHSIFGVAQTINSATYVLMSSISEAAKLSGKNCASIVTAGVCTMLLGQSTDLQSTYLIQCPTEEEYLRIVDNKTGGLFQISHKLLQVESKSLLKPDLGLLMILLGRFFQIRDDYMNLTSHEYTDQKGFCEDLDEGKFSLALIHCMNSNLMQGESGISYKLELQNIFTSRSRTVDHTLSPAMKHRVLEILAATKSLEFTKIRLLKLQEDIGNEIRRLEEETGIQNPLFHQLAEKLMVS